jgi:hypothetical protein
MLLSDLIGVNVETTTGQDLGRVRDVMLVQDGPLGARGQAGLRLHALSVGTRSFGTRLGYTQGTVQGPWLLRVLFAREPRLVPWPAIVHRDKERIVVDAERLNATTEPTPPDA